jgi:quercetin 2,3-dioxygenase
MEKILHSSASRGHANHGWLESYHSFSFAGYYEAERIHFGALRVLNDDKVDGGQGFGAHPHDNMEIISIPLEGSLKHQDSLGNKAIIRRGDVQVMSAGTGVTHSEFNADPSLPVKFLQIWLFPDKKNVTPRYGQITLMDEDRLNRLQLIVSPDGEQGSAWIHQQAWFYMCSLEKGKKAEHRLHNVQNGVYLFVLEGGVGAAGETLGRRDALGAWKTEALEITATENSELLLMEVPMLS